MKSMVNHGKSTFSESSASLPRCAGGLRTEMPGSKAESCELQFLDARSFILHSRLLKVDCQCLAKVSLRQKWRI